MYCEQCSLQNEMCQLKHTYPTEKNTENVQRNDMALLVKERAVSVHLYSIGIVEKSWPGVSLSTDCSLRSHQESDVTLGQVLTYVLR